MHSVIVLMSVYNGSKYLKEQIDSILNQKNVDLTLMIRNDGSSDDSINILNEYALNNKNIILLNEENIGLAKSFMKMVYEAKTSYDFYSFADQDDVWLEDKLYSAISMIENKTRPALYSSNQELVDSELNTIKIRYNEPANVDFKQIVSNNLISGCTFIWNKSLQQLLVNPKCKPSDELLRKRIHDVWVAAVGATCGDVVFDMNSHIKYRQHTNNVVGVRKESRIKSFINKFQNKDLRNGRSQLAFEIYSKFYDFIINEEIKNELNVLGNYSTNRKLKRALLSKTKIYKTYNNESSFEFRFKVRMNLF